MKAALRTLVLGEPEELAAIEAAWWHLFARCPAATPFQSPAWQRAWWSVFAPGRLCAVAVFRGDPPEADPTPSETPAKVTMVQGLQSGAMPRSPGDLVALALLYLEDGPHGRRLLPVGIGLSDYADILVDPAVPEAGPALAAGLRQVPGWEVLSLEDLRAGAAALSLDLGRGLCETVGPGAVCPVLDLSGGNPVPADRRRKVRRAIRAAEARGGLAIERIGDPAAVPDAIGQLCALHEARWSARGEAGLTADPRVRAFHLAAAPDLVRRDLARLFVLRIGGRDAAVWYGLADGGTVYAYMGGFDPGFADESPGSILTMHAIEEAVLSGRHRFDFLRGAEPYKAGFGARDTRSVRRIVARAP